MVVGCRLERERRIDVGRRGGDGRRTGGKGHVVNFLRIPKSCETASAPSTFVNA